MKKKGGEGFDISFFFFSFLCNFSGGVWCFAFVFWGGGGGGGGGVVVVGRCSNANKSE